MSYPLECQSCKASMDGGEIPERIREHYSPPYRWSRAIFVKPADVWRCPECAHEWSDVIKG